MHQRSGQEIASVATGQDRVEYYGGAEMLTDGLGTCGCETCRAKQPDEMNSFR